MADADRHRADGHGIEEAEVLSEADALLLHARELSFPVDLHPDHGLAVLLHLAENLNDLGDRAVHLGSLRIDARQDDVHPGTARRGLHGAEVVARDPNRADLLLLLCLGEHVHVPLEIVEPVRLDEAVHEHDVEVVGIELLPETLHRGPGRDLLDLR